MKNRNIIAILICIIFASCGEDRRPEYAEKTELNRTIESAMRQNYYWYENMPESKSLNFFTKPASAFFKSMLVKEDLNYSYLEDPTDKEDLISYGIEFDASFTFNNDTAYALRVLYVDSDSPAYDAGLERGDWIIKRNDRFITKNRIDSLYKGGPIKLTLGKYVELLDENELPMDHFEEKETINIGAARITSDNPIHASKVFVGSKSTIGYLAYNHFASGETNNDETYDNALRAISNSFKSQGVTEFVLDLRYNTGGNLKSAQLLGSILAPQVALGDTMCYLKYNNLQSSKDEALLFSNEILRSGSNLNLERLYVLTGSSTAATSDVLINALKPYMKIIQVGQSTKGNHTGTHEITDDAFHPYILHPVDCMIHNAKGESPTTGFTASYSLNEVIYTGMRLIGDMEEVLLLSALCLIEIDAIPKFDRYGNIVEAEEETRSMNNKRVPGFNTLQNIPIRGTSIP